MKNPHGAPASPTASPRMFARLRGSFSQTWRTLALVWRSSRAQAILLGVLTLVAAIVPLGIAWVGKAITDAVVAHDAHATLRFVLLELALIAAQAAVMRALGLVKQVLGLRLSIDINVAILEKAQTLELRHFEDAEFYDQLTKARREASSRPLSVVTTSFTLVQNVITLAGYILLLVKFSGFAVIGLVIAAIPATVAEMKFSQQAFRLRNWRSPETRKLNYLEYVLANDSHAKEVKIFGVGPLLLERYKKLSDVFFEDDKTLAKQRAGWGYALSLIGTGAFYGCYALMALATAAGKITLGTMMLYVVAFRQGQQAFQSILSGIAGMYEDNLYMSNLFQYLEIDVDQKSLISKAQRELADGNGASSNGAEKSGIVFDDVGFQYPGGEKWALRHVSLHVPAGESIALVGHNGAGKTTFIKLLTRLYDPTEGRILLDGRDLRDWDRDRLRKRIGVVFQDFNEYQLEASENVGLGSVEHIDDEPRLDRAIDRGGATEVVAGLPKGKKTQLGRWFKDGVELSGGQWQKLALSRAFMREEADILVLDEPTAALDAEAEHAVFERFKTLAKGRTSILISHRFPTVRMADRIIVIEQGALLEEGTHGDLVAKKGRYAQLFALQASGYQ